MTGLLEIAIGLSLILIGVLLVAAPLALQRGEVKGGGIVLIGPFPIIFGGSKALLLVFLIFMFALIAFIILSMHVGGVL